VSEASLRGHLKNEDEAAKGKQEELGSSSYVNPDKAKDTQLVYALGLLHGVDSMISDTSKTRAEAN
jgi:carboxyl-terminal processing protease